MTLPLRVALVDIARTVAIIAMAIFHFTYDLEVFGFAPRGTMASTEWILFAQGIAGSFLFLSGVSLVLASLNGPFRAPKYIKRLAMIGLAAAAVSVGTYVAMGAAFVRFGILHNMFFASIIGLAFLHRPFWISGVLGVALLAFPHTTYWPFLDGAHWLWLGKTLTPMPAMVDYVPLVPWLGAFLLSMSFAQILARLQQWQNIAGLMKHDTRWIRVMSWPGQHSLAIYLIHQPVLFGTVSGARYFIG